MQNFSEILKILHTQKYSFLVNKIIVTYILYDVKLFTFSVFFHIFNHEYSILIVYL